MADVYMESSAKIKTALGFGPHSPIQRFVDETVAREMDKMVPFDTGALKNSVQGSVMGSGRLVYNVPYAKAQFYKGRDVQGDARGRLWSVRYQRLFGRRLSQEVQAYVEKYHE